MKKNGHERPAYYPPATEPVATMQGNGKRLWDYVPDYSLQPADMTYTRERSLEIEENRNAVIAQALQAQG